MSKYFYIILFVLFLTGWVYVYKSHQDRFNAPAKKTASQTQKYIDITSKILGMHDWQSKGYPLKTQEN